MRRIVVHYSASGNTKKIAKGEEIALLPFTPPAMFSLHQIVASSSVLPQPVGYRYYQYIGLMETFNNQNCKCSC